jgi:hypothetical protein
VLEVLDPLSCLLSFYGTAQSESDKTEPRKIYRRSGNERNKDCILCCGCALDDHGSRWWRLTEKEKRTGKKKAEPVPAASTAGEETKGLVMPWIGLNHLDVEMIIPTPKSSNLAYARSIYMGLRK